MQKHAQAVISSLKNKYGYILTTRKNLDSICHNIYQDLYKYRAISEEALVEVFEGFPVTFTDDMIVSIIKRITEMNLTAMGKGKTPGHDGIPIEFFQELWPTLEDDYLQMILQGIQNKT